jgi:surfeit locus 1 family protein
MNKSLTNFVKTFIYPFIEYLILVVFVLALIELGQWQLFRAKQKQDILKHYQMMQNQSIINWSAKEKAPHAYQRVRIKGQALKKIFYLDNQFYQHQIGFNGLVAVETDDGATIMVDLGWIPAGVERHDLPFVDVPNQQEWIGTVYYPPTNCLQLGQTVDFQQAQMSVIESICFVDLEKILDRHLQLWVLRLNPSSDSQMIRKWPLVNVMPERHRAYALQWFVMAFVVGIILLWRVFKYAKKYF